MYPPRRLLLVLFGTLACGLLQGAPRAGAQDCLGRADFDACVAAAIGQRQADNAAAQQRIFQQYLAAYGPWLQQQYAQYRAQGGPMSYPEFAWWNLMTANGTNVQGAMAAQRDRFEGWQRANRTVQEGFASYNDGARANGARTDAAIGRYADEAIRGQAPYVDPRTGATVMLPYAAAPGRPFEQGGTTYVQAPDGTYRQWQGQGWVPLYPAAPR
ncbi:hypothetical protein M0638_06720 [Roseomonas sp. NAR14]|uniref:Uncharacterized protein n=1 Tax=Roseomonas acroporae TaxID=2937791 RepID=A0A9X1Y5W4_9PROT|nr:hypothetical protein [Roseomonas acroporae]MCK8784071.1 hypothetical protein [Roseomonas acroporae]